MGLRNPPGLLLSPNIAPDSSTSVQLVVTATQTITNDTYRAAPDGNLSAVGKDPIVTTIGQPVTKYYYFGSQRVAMRSEAEGMTFIFQGGHVGPP
jgi:hypothetical protein